MPKIHDLGKINMSLSQPKIPAPPPAPPPPAKQE